MELFKMNIKYYLVTLTFISIISCDPVPGITKCKLDDSECVTNSANAFVATMSAGLPQYGVNILDPHFVKHMDFSTPNLKLVGMDLTITGLKDTVIKHIKISKEKSTMQTKVLLNIKLDGQYEMNGRLILLPLEGKGPFHGIIRNMECTVDADFNEVTGKDGKTHWQVKYRNHSYILKEKSDVVFENLFNGNEVLAGAAKEVIAASGNEIIVEAGGPLIMDLITSIHKEVNNFFEAVAAGDLALD